MMTRQWATTKNDIIAESAEEISEAKLVATVALLLRWWYRLGTPYEPEKGNSTWNQGLVIEVELAPRLL
jgi:hypothetical protein